MVMPEGLIKMLFTFVLLTAALIITRRDMLGIITTYAAQSLLISAVAGILYISGGSEMLLTIALLTLFCKVMLIPAIMKGIQRQIKIKRDVEFSYLSPTTALAASMVMLLAVYALLSGVLEEFALSRIFIFGAVAGISLMLMGMLVIFSRRQTITAIVGYLTMENGVVLMSLFLTELPLIIEVLVVVDLIGIMLLAAILSFGISSDMEEFHQKLVRPFSAGNNRRGSR